MQIYNNNNDMHANGPIFFSAVVNTKVSTRINYNTVKCLNMPSVPFSEKHSAQIYVFLKFYHREFPLGQLRSIYLN